MIHKTKNNTFVISKLGTWLPGSFATKGAAQMATKLSDAEIETLQKKRGQ